MGEWKNCYVGDLGTVITGKTPSTRQSNYWNGSTMFVTPKDIQGVKHIRTTERYITDSGLHSVHRSLLSPNAICVSCIGNIGYVAMTTQECISNQQINSIIVNKDNDADFVYYLMRNLWTFFKNYEGQSTALSILNKTQFSKIEVRLPASLKEQKQIASVLSALDDKIEKNIELNRNLEEQARLLYKSWFVDFEPFGNSAPADWEYGKLKDILQLNRNSIKAGANTTLPYLPIDIIPMKTFAITEFKPNEEAQSSLVAFSKNDILIGAMRVYFHRVVIAPCDGITRTTCFTLRPYQSEYLSFGLLCCDQDSSIEYAQTTSKGSTMPYAVWEGGLGEMEILIPSLTIANQFNAIVLPMLNKIQSSYYENLALRRLRDTLLPRLMSGELDVSNIDL